METDQITASIGNILLGPGHPVMIQSMCSVPTMDTQACVDQCIRIFDAGGGLSRITARNIEEARNLDIIRRELNRRNYLQPISADVHFNPAIAEIAATLVEKVRINPGNFTSGDIEKPFLELLNICRENNTAIRIGVNHGSLSERILQKYGDTPEGMVESALEYLRICRRENFNNTIVSLKSSNTRIMVYANRLMQKCMEEEKLEYPVHLGVTEAGEGEDGRIRSAAGIGTLLEEGIGHTIRVSLTEDPEMEISAAKKVLESSAGKSEKLGGYYVNEFKRRDSKAYGILGGGQIPVVIARKAGTNGSDPDFCFIPDHRLPDDPSSRKKYILNAEAWLLEEYPPDNFFPLFDLPGFISSRKTSETLNFILVRPDEIKKAIKDLKPDEVPCCLVYMHDGNPSSKEKFLHQSENIHSGLPVVVHGTYKDHDIELFQIRAASELAWYFIDGYADGIWLDNPFVDASVALSTSFKILQATRARMTETEYISCPSCGRTLFNIQKTLAEVKQATSHLKHLKIAVMGCIVNGPGEMADADYGYVGTGKGKVSLYRNRQAVKKGIRERDAVKELVLLIKENGDWID